MWKLGRVFGIDISLHWTLLLLIGWIGLSAPSGGVVGSVALVSAIFGCVLLHELGHSLAAKQFGINTSSIVLLPIGGIASLERMPRKPKQELWIAVAGPLVNVIIALMLFVMIGPINLVAPGLSGWFQQLMFTNFLLVVFNMLPAFPMDGGRVLRSVLAMRIPYLRATEIAVAVVKFVAVGLGAVGFVVGHFMLMLIAAFVFFAGAAEARMVAREQFKTRWGDIVGQNKSGRTTFPHEYPHAKFVRESDEPTVIWDEIERRYRYAS